MADYLPPVVVRVTSEFDAKGLAAAKAALDEFKKQQTTAFGAQGKAAGKAFGDALPGGAQPGLDAFVRKTKASDDVLVRMMADFNRVGEGASRFGRTLTDDGNYAKFLEERLGLLGGEARKLAEEFNRTGNIDIYKKFKENRGEQDTLYRVKKDLVQAFEAVGKEAEKGIADLLSQTGPQFSKTFWGAVSSLPPQVQVAVVAGLAGMVAVAAPAIGATISGALLAGVGAAGIGIAIAGQLHNPAVTAGLAHLKTDFSNSLAAATAPMRESLLSGIDELDKMIGRITPGLTKAFAAMAPGAEQFFAGVAKMVENTMPGFEHAMVEGSKILGQLGAVDLPELGRAFSEFFDMIADGSRGSGQALHYIFVGAEATILALGFALRELSEDFARLNLLAAIASGDPVKIANALEALRDTGVPALNATGDAAGQLGDRMADLTTKAEHAALTMTDRLLDSLLGSAHATLGFEEALTRATESVKQNGLTLDIHKKQGQQNAEAVLGMVEANKRIYDQMMANGATVDAATAKWDENTRRIYAWGTKVGIGKDKLDGLIGSMKGVPDDVKLRIDTQPVEVALDRLNNLIRRINHLAELNPEVRVRVHADIFGAGEKYISKALGGVVGEYAGALNAIHAASGLNSGILPPRHPGTLVLAGEPGTKGEVFAPLAGISQGRAMSLAQVVGDAYDFDVAPRGPSPAMLSSMVGPSARATASGTGTGTGSAAESVIHLHVHNYLDGKELHQGMIPHAQRYRIRTGTTGLETPP